jgi:adenine-specific DNA-methyltransferase
METQEPTHLKPSEITVKPHRARKVFDPAKLVELRKSIAEVGLIEPLVVTREGDKIVLVAGERRLRSALVPPALPLVPVIFKTVDVDGKISGLSELDQRLIELHENVGRQDLSWSETAFLMKEIHELHQKKHGQGGKGSKEGWTKGDTAKLMGVSEKTVYTNLLMADRVKADPSIIERMGSLPLAAVLQKIDQEETTKRVTALVASGTIQPTTDFRHGSCVDLIKAIPSDSIDCVITDSPYGIPNLDKSRGEQQIYTSVLKKTDNLGVEAVKDLINRLAPELFRVMKDGSHLWYFFGWDLFEFTKTQLTAAGFDVVQFPVIWKKNKITVSFKGYEPSPCYEQILVAHKGKRSRRMKEAFKSIIEFDAISSTIQTHPFEKPSLLLEFMINQSTDAGQTILDPFAGTGSTLRTARQMGRSAIGFELDKDHWSKGTELLHEDEKRRGKK